MKAVFSGAWLRHTAAAVAGDENRGDIYAVAVADILAADPQALPAGSSLRVRCAKLLIALLSSVAALVGIRDDQGGNAAGSNRSLAEILVEDVGFTLEEAAEILSPAPDRHSAVPTHLLLIDHPSSGDSNKAASTLRVDSQDGESSPSILVTSVGNPPAMRSRADLSAVLSIAKTARDK